MVTSEKDVDYFVRESEYGSTFNICLADIEIVKAHGLVDGISRAGLTVIFS